MEKQMQRHIEKSKKQALPFYDLSKQQRAGLVIEIQNEIAIELKKGQLKKTLAYFANEDTYVRKSAYLSIGRIYFENPNLEEKIIDTLNILRQEDDFKIRQTVINAAGEIGKKDFAVVQSFFDKGLFDPHPSPRNAVIGSIKKMGEVNPTPVLDWAKKYLHHKDEEIRREICHGIELRGRKHPQDILPMLRELQYDKTARVRNTLVHVIGQIAYKKGCLATMIAHLKSWDNQELVAEALKEIIDVHHRYRDFAALTPGEATKYISENF
ncbi:MAG: HEAT repeat domain-containing protein [Ferruginibacter sp.]